MDNNKNTTNKTEFSPEEMDFIAKMGVNPEIGYANVKGICHAIDYHFSESTIHRKMRRIRQINNIPNGGLVPLRTFLKHILFKEQRFCAFYLQQ